MSDFERRNDPGDVTLESKGSDPTAGANADADRARPGRLDDFASSVREFAQKLPESIGRAIDSAQTAITNRANAITIHVDDDAQRRIDQLVEAGIFKTRSDSAAYLISEGIRARGDVFGAIGSRIAEIERLRAEMRTIVAEAEPPQNPS